MAALRDDLMKRVPVALHDYWQWMVASALSLPFTVLYQRWGLRADFLGEVFLPLATGGSIEWPKVHDELAWGADPHNLMTLEDLVEKVRPVGQDIATMADVLEVLFARARREGLGDDIIADTLRMASMLGDELMKRIDVMGEAVGEEIRAADQQRGRDAS
jgi:hypothetical protein